MSRPFNTWCVGSRRFCQSLIVAFLTIAAAGASSARASTPPLLEFDIPFVISCRDVTPKDFAHKNPGKKLVEAVFRLSTFVRAGSEKDLKQCVYTFSDVKATETLLVSDFLPRTELGTEYAKPIEVVNERDAKIGVNLSAHYEITATGDAGGQLKSSVKYEKLPPRETLLASGTIHEGYGVFFKLRPSSQTTLEGSKSFSAIFVVPRSWRGDWIRLECEAVGVDRALLPTLSHEVSSGMAGFSLALYLEGDSQAEEVAEQMAERQHELFDTLTRQRHEVMSAASKKFPFAPGGRFWFLDQFFPHGDATTAAGEAAFLNCVLHRCTGKTCPPAGMPESVKQRLEALREAADALGALSGSDH